MEARKPSNWETKHVHAIVFFGDPQGRPVPLGYGRSIPVRILSVSEIDRWTLELRLVAVRVRKLQIGSALFNTPIFVQKCATPFAIC
jgi:hypothetical protein